MSPVACAIASHERPAARASRTQACRTLAACSTASEASRSRPAWSGGPSAGVTTTSTAGGSDSRGSRRRRRAALPTPQTLAHSVAHFVRFPVSGPSPAPFSLFSAVASSQVRASRCLSRTVVAHRTSPGGRPLRSPPGQPALTGLPPPAPTPPADHRVRGRPVKGPRKRGPPLDSSPPAPVLCLWGGAGGLGGP